MRVISCAPTAVGRALIAAILAGRVLIAATLVVTAGRVLMAVIVIVEDDVFIRGEENMARERTRAGVGEFVAGACGIPRH